MCKGFGGRQRLDSQADLDVHQPLATWFNHQLSSDVSSSGCAAGGMGGTPPFFRQQLLQASLQQRHVICSGDLKWPKYRAPTESWIHQFHFMSQTPDYAQVDFSGMQEPK